MQTCLEQTGIEKRKVELVRNDYNKNDKYDSTHPNALNTDENNLDEKGKGTGSGGHIAWKPSCNPKFDGSQNAINYTNFDTSRGGNLFDVEGCKYNGTEKSAGRRFMQLQSKWSPENPYGTNVVDCTESIREGQYVCE